MNYLKNNRRMDQDALIEYILSALSDGEFIYGPEESSLVMESSPPSPKHYPYDSSSCGSVLYITMVLKTGIPITTLPEYSCGMIIVLLSQAIISCVYERPGMMGVSNPSTQSSKPISDNASTSVIFSNKSDAECYHCAVPAGFFSLSCWMYFPFC